MTPDDKCGTYAGYQQHKRDRTEPCAPCRAANREYTAQWRNHPGHRASVNRTNTIRSRALWRLAEAHRDEFNRLVRDEERRDREAARDRVLDGDQRTETP